MHTNHAHRLKEVECNTQWNVAGCALIELTTVHSCKIYVLQICENRKLQHTTDYITYNPGDLVSQHTGKARQFMSTVLVPVQGVGLEVVQMRAH